MQTMSSSSLTLSFITSFLFFFSTYARVVYAQESGSLQGKHGSTFSAVYAFGGSYTDTGNACTMTSLKGSFGANCQRSGGRLSNGKLAVDYVSASFSLPSPQPWLNISKNSYSATPGALSTATSGVNFAIAGSSSLQHKYFTNQDLSHVIWKGIPMTIQTQVHWFRNFLREKNCMGKHAHRCIEEFKNALFWVGPIGISDYYNVQGTSIAQKWLTQLSIQQFTKVIEALINAGAKYIVAEGLPPLGCFPLSVSQSEGHKLDQNGCAVPVNSAIKLHNQILKSKVGELQRRCHECSILYADFWKAYETIVMTPAKYHLEETKKACCGTGKGDLNFDPKMVCGSPTTSACTDPAKYVSWDGIHITEAMQRQVADLYLNQGFCEPSFDTMIKHKSSI
ncbi:PREDICTED: GDSL esterase/lipase At3g48460-like [Ipomoea nil]|uniref:GDSL esterase/lipase At3g48460-like n=1 Tax=Ipomoea nil TaxID=35883 RepID=UPI000900F9D2|nr:PREDICTED: GDSL esterase/lipase At3g48460-like [Ipomoea nil]